MCLILQQHVNGIQPEIIAIREQDSIFLVTNKSLIRRSIGIDAYSSHSSSIEELYWRSTAIKRVIKQGAEHYIELPC